MVVVFLQCMDSSVIYMTSNINKIMSYLYDYIHLFSWLYLFRNTMEREINYPKFDKTKLRNFKGNF